MAIKRVLMCIFLFSVPYIVTAVNSLLGGLGVGYSECIRIAKSNEDLSKYRIDIPKDEGPGESIGLEKGNSIVTPGSGSNGSSGKGKILLIAGHSFFPHCHDYVTSKGADDCREDLDTSIWGYSEPIETRKLVLLLKKALVKEGYADYDIDIANQLLGEDLNDSFLKDDYSAAVKTNKSLFVESHIDSDYAKKVNISQYKYGIEIHFNGSKTHTASGVRAYCSNTFSSDVTDGVTLDILKRVEKVLNSGKLLMSDNWHDCTLFKDAGVPFTYLETEFYDNRFAMDKYASHREEVAAAIAKAIKKHYP